MSYVVAAYVITLVTLAAYVGTVVARSRQADRDTPTDDDAP